MNNLSNDTAILFPSDAAPPPLPPPTAPMVIILRSTAIAAGVALVLVPIFCGMLCLCIRRRSYRVERQQTGILPVTPAPADATTRPPLRLPSAQHPISPAERAAADALERERVVALKSLPTFRWSRTVKESDIQDECVLCIEAYRTNATLRRLPCGHCFHKDCIDKWLIHSMVHMTRACPLCKADPIPHVCKVARVAAADGTLHAVLPAEAARTASHNAAANGRRGGARSTAAARPPVEAVAPAAIAAAGEDVDFRAAGGGLNRPSHAEAHIMQPPPASPVQQPAELVADPQLMQAAAAAAPPRSPVRQMAHAVRSASRADGVGL